MSEIPNSISIQDIEKLYENILGLIDNQDEIKSILSNIDLKTLELLHVLSHVKTSQLGDIGCRSHFLIANEMIDKGMKHINRYICDTVVDLIRNIKTYDPSTVSDRVLLDDHRILHAWISRLKQGNRFNSYQFKDMTLEEQINIVEDLLKRVKEEMIKRGFNVSDMCLSDKQIDPRDIEPNMLRDMNDNDLLDLYKRIHDLAKDKITEDLMNANIFIGIEMLKRGLYERNKIKDQLTDITDQSISEYPTIEGFSSDKSTITLDEVLEVLQKIPNIQIESQPYACYLAGRLVNEGKIEGEDQDIDLVFRQRPDPRLIASIHRALPKWLSDRIHIVFDPIGSVIGYSIPIYQYGLFLIPKSEMKRGFGAFRYEDLSLKPLMKIRLLKQKTGWGKNEFSDFDDLWTNWASKYIDRGIYCSVKEDGRSFLIWVLKDGRVEFITEDEMRDRSDQLPNISAELREIFKGHDVCIHAECVAYDCNGKIIKNAKLKKESCDEIPREDTAFITIGNISPEQEESLVFHAHDLIYYDEDISQKPYSERFKILSEIIPDDCKYIALIVSRYADNYGDFKDAVLDLRKYKGSEGVFFRSSDAVYPIKTSGDNRSSHLAKIKNLKRINVMVWNVIPKKDTDTGKPLDEYMYECVFRIPESEKDNFLNVIEWKDKYYSMIGTTYATSVKCNRGDIISVLVGRVREYSKSSKNNYITWSFPKFEKKITDRSEPDDLDFMRKITKVGSGYIENLSKIIKLKPCPYASDTDVCPLKLIFGSFRDQELTKFEYLKFPIICPIASFYKCRYLKPYYYGVKEFDLNDLKIGDDDED